MRSWTQVWCVANCLGCDQPRRGFAQQSVFTLLSCPIASCVEAEARCREEGGNIVVSACTITMRCFNGFRVPRFRGADCYTASPPEVLALRHVVQMEAGPRGKTIWFARWKGAWALGCALCAEALARRQVLGDTAGTQQSKGSARTNCSWARYEVRPCETACMFRLP